MGGPTGGPAAPPSFHFSPRPNRAHEIRWREWGPDAFREAKEQERPILLGISAVWCHWCHVMDETSYSDPEVIRLANERFVPVRVDNDQRPDVNRRYNMGGWPTTAFLSPEGEILHGGTYIPPPVMRETLAQVADVWRDRREELTARITEARDKEAAGGRVSPAAPEERRGALTWDIVDTVGSLIRGQYDPQYGGFGREPKFPQPKLLRFVIDEHRRHGYPELATMLHKTLGAMASGGMYDAVEGGFFRYSTTRQWQIPHYEKMLEDNAELLAVYSEAHRSFPNAGYDRIVRDVIRWMDATLWREDVKAFAGSQDADEHYYSLGSQEDRAKHGRPYVDPTIYTGWNALAASGYHLAATALGDERIREHTGAIRTIDSRMRGADGTLYHFMATDGAPAVGDLLTDDAAYLQALLDAYESATGHPEHWGIPLRKAIEIATRMRERLEDPKGGGFWDAPEREELGRVTKREKPIEDNALAADSLLRLAALTGDDSWRRSAVRALEGFVGEYRQWGQFAAAYASAVARALTEPLVIVVVGTAGDAAAEDLWRIAQRSEDPALSLHRLDPGRDAERLATLGYPPDRTAAYVCVGTVCSDPIASPGDLERELARAKARFERA
jgi:uncharacterized protein YyaL (SSP411 family)